MNCNLIALRGAALALGLLGNLVCVSAVSADEAPLPTFQPDSPLSALLESIPGVSVTVAWLPDTQVIRYEESQLDFEKTLPALRERYAQWCKARSGKIVQPRENNCAMLRSGFGCAVGELQQPGLGTNFERGLKNLAAGSGDKVEIGWPKASWVISRKMLFNIFLNQGAKEISIVGGLQRCVAQQDAPIGALAFASINGNNDLLFFEPVAYDRLIQRGSELNRIAAEKRQAAEQQKKDQELAKLAALTPGTVVRHVIGGWRGIIIEMKPPMAQVQWDRLGTKTLEWNRLEDLRQ